MYEIKGHAHLELKRYDDAIRDFDKAMKIDPKNYAEAEVEYKR
jgi:tetratricopeptide (TPR) repeat protein